MRSLPQAAPYNPKISNSILFNPLNSLRLSVCKTWQLLSAVGAWELIVTGFAGTRRCVIEGVTS